MRRLAAMSGIGADKKSIDLDGSTEFLGNSTANLIGIADIWTLMAWVYPEDDSVQNGIVHCNTGSDQPNGFALDLMGDEANNPLRVNLRHSSNGVLKQWRVDDFFTLNTWHQIVVTWTGNDDLKLYGGGSLIGDGDITKTIDNTDNMSDTGRYFWIGTFDSGPTVPLDGRVHSVALWNAVLGSTAVVAIYNSGDASGVDLRVNRGNYTQAANLKHWWRLGVKSNDIGRDWGRAALLIDVMTNAANISTSDIVTSYPGE